MLSPPKKAPPLLHFRKASSSNAIPCPIFSITFAFSSSPSAFLSSPRCPEKCNGTIIGIVRENGGAISPDLINVEGDLRPVHIRARPYTYKLHITSSHGWLHLQNFLKNNAQD
nr:hypothetical protein Iba_chr15aCG14400 [Ipomoea batatas]